MKVLELKGNCTDYTQTNHIHYGILENTTVHRPGCSVEHMWNTCLAGKLPATRSRETEILDS